MCMSIYTIETHIAYCNELYCTHKRKRKMFYIINNNYQSSSFLEFGINRKSKAASTFSEQCGHVKLFSNH